MGKRNKQPDTSDNADIQEVQDFIDAVAEQQDRPDSGVVDSMARPSNPDPLETIMDLRQLPVPIREILPAANGEDYKTARDGLHRLLGVGETALAELAAIARSSQSPRAYEVLNQNLKTLAETYRDLVDIQLKKMDGEMDGGSDEDGPQIVNNTLVVRMTPAEMLDYINNNVDTKTKTIEHDTEKQTD